MKLLSRLPGRKDQRREYAYDNMPEETPQSKTGITFTKEGDKTHPRANIQHGSGWNPLSLTRIALLSFVAIFLACLLALLLLWHFSNKNDGLDLIASNQYAWIYGPTAVLIVLTSLWRQVDYHCKVLTPWQELQKGFAGAPRSILLDYSSAFQVVAFIRAIQNSHVATVVTILGFVTLKVITVTSTSLLFATTTRTSPRNVDLAGFTKLNASHYNATLSRDKPHIPLVYPVYALMRKGLPYAEGTTSNMVYDTFSLPDVTEFPNVTFNANVQAFFPKYNCSPISISPFMEDPHPFRDEYIDWSATVDTTACKGHHFDFSVSLKPEKHFCPPRVMTAVLNAVNCPNVSKDADDMTYQKRGSQHILSMTDFRYTQVINPSTVTSNLTYGDRVETESWSIELDVSSIICYPYYTVQTVVVTYDMSESPPEISIAEPAAGSETQFETFSNQDLQKDFYSLFHRAPVLPRTPSTLPYEFENGSAISELMAEAIDGSFEDLLNETVLADTAELIFEHIAVQIAKRYLTQPDHSTYQGEAVFSEERLQVRTLAVAIMATGFGLMAIMGVAVLLTRPFEVAPCNPESVASIGGSLAHSKGFQQWLQECARSIENDAGCVLKQGQYSSSVHADLGSSHIEIHHHHNPSGIRSGNSVARLAWWAPFTLRKASILLTLLSPLVVIAALEVLQRISDNNNGFASALNVSSTVMSIYTRFLPALIMLLVATLFNCLDFNASCLAPFISLTSWKNRGYQNMTQPLLGQYPPFALWTALRLRYWPAVLTAVAVFVGSVLTIIVSGLLTVENVPYASAVSLKQLDKWNTNWTESSTDDRGAAVLLSLIESTNLSYPAFTYDELAFPTLGEAIFVSNSNGNTQSAGLISVQVPAVRGKLECTRLAREHYNFTTRPVRRGSYDAWRMNLTAAAPLPSHCLLGGPYANESTVEVYESSEMFEIINNSNAIYFAQIKTLHVGPYNDVEGVSSRERVFQQPDNPPGCPSLAFWFGYADPNNMDNTKDTLLICDQQLEQVTTDVTLTYPKYLISPDHPPIPDESTATLLPSGPNNETAFWWRLQPNWEDRLWLFNQSIVATVNDGALIATFFQGVLDGKDPMRLGTLLDSTTTFTGIQRFYRRYMAQAISSNMRVHLNTTSTSRLKARQTVDDSTSFTGTYVPTMGTARLVQQRTPKLVLQVMLAVMFMCGTMSWVLGDFHKVVPWNPCTIAGVAVLLAGSRMCDPQNRKPQESRESLDQNRECDAVQAHGRTHESSVDAFLYGVSLPPLRDYHSNNDEIEMCSVSTSIEAGMTASNHPESEVHLISGSASVMTQRQNRTDNGKGSGKMEDQWRGMKFRLGWWRDGSFMGKHGPPVSSSGGSANVKTLGREDRHERGFRFDNEVEREQEAARWRYGIDIVSEDQQGKDI